MQPKTEAPLGIKAEQADADWLDQLGKDLDVEVDVKSAQGDDGMHEEGETWYWGLL